jgi:hypothetical protein
VTPDFAEAFIREFADKFNVRLISGSDRVLEDSLVGVAFVGLGVFPSSTQALNLGSVSLLLYSLTPVSRR